MVLPHGKSLSQEVSVTGRALSKGGLHPGRPRFPGEDSTREVSISGGARHSGEDVYSRREISILGEGLFPGGRSLSSGGGLYPKEASVPGEDSPAEHLAILSACQPRAWPMSHQEGSSTKAPSRAPRGLCARHQRVEEARPAPTQALQMCVRPASGQLWLRILHPEQGPFTPSGFHASRVISYKMAPTPQFLP